MEKFDTLAGLAVIAAKNRDKHFDYYELYEAIEKSYIPAKTWFLSQVSCTISSDEDTGEVYLTGGEILQLIKEHEWALERGLL